MLAKRRIGDISSGTEDTRPDAADAADHELLPTLSSLPSPPSSLLTSLLSLPSSLSSSLSLSSLSLSSTPSSTSTSTLIGEEKVESSHRDKMSKLDKIEIETKEPTTLSEKVLLSISDFVRDGKMMVKIPAECRGPHDSRKLENFHTLWTSATEHLVYRDAWNKLRIDRVGKAGVEAVISYSDPSRPGQYNTYPASSAHSSDGNSTSTSSSSSAGPDAKSNQGIVHPDLVAFRNQDEVNLHLANSATHVEISYLDLPTDFQQQLKASNSNDSITDRDLIWKAWLNGIMDRKTVHDNLPHTCAIEVARQMLSRDPDLKTEVRRLFASEWQKGDTLKIYSEKDHTVNGKELAYAYTWNVTLVRREEILVPAAPEVFPNDTVDASMTLSVRSEKALPKDQNGAWILVYCEYYKDSDFAIGTEGSKDEGKVVVDKIRRLPNALGAIPRSPFVPGQKLPFTSVVYVGRGDSANGTAKYVERRVTLSVDDLYILVK